MLLTSVWVRNVQISSANSPLGRTDLKGRKECPKGLRHRPDKGQGW
jgi:hypothetical protein